MSHTFMRNIPIMVSRHTRRIIFYHSYSYFS